MFIIATLGLGATILVFTVLGGVAICKCFPFFLGTTLGIGSLLIHSALLRVENLVALAVFFMFIPTLLIGYWYSRNAPVDNKKERVKKAALAYIFSLPFVSTITLIIFEKCLNPLDYWYTMIDTSDKALMWSQIATQQEKNESYIQAMRLINDTINYSSIPVILFILFCGLAWIYGKIKQGYDEEMAKH